MRSWQAGKGLSTLLEKSERHLIKIKGMYGFSEKAGDIDKSHCLYIWRHFRYDMFSALGMETVSSLEVHP